VTGYRADRGPEELIPDCGYGLVSGTSGSILIGGDRSGKSVGGGGGIHGIGAWRRRDEFRSLDAEGFFICSSFQMKPLGHEESPRTKRERQTPTLLHMISHTQGGKGKCEMWEGAGVEWKGKGKD
jgi:hypothetical protein